MPSRGTRAILSAVVVCATLVAVTSAPALAAAHSPAAPASATGSAVSGATATAPACTFNGVSLPLISNVSAGTTIAVSCSGLPPLHPYLFLQTSLVLGIDPKVSALLSGNILSFPGLLAALAALPEIDLGAISLQSSDLQGDLSFTYTTPTSQAADPNAVCPPTPLEYDSGLIGCALAMIDLTSFTTVGAGSALLEPAGAGPVPEPTLALSASKGLQAGQVVTVGDAPGATSYWWLATLNDLQALLGGSGGAAPVLTIKISGSRKVVATTGITITPASYDGTTFTPPALSGTFTVPSGLKGHHKLTLTYTAALEGLGISISASVPVSF